MSRARTQLGRQRLPREGGPTSLEEVHARFPAGDCQAQGSHRMANVLFAYGRHQVGRRGG